MAGMSLLAGAIMGRADRPLDWDVHVFNIEHRRKYNSDHNTPITRAVNITSCKMR